MNMDKVILIGDPVTLKKGQGQNRHRYMGQEGRVVETQLDASSGELRHRVEFVPLPLTPEEEESMAYVEVDDGEGGKRKVLNLDSMAQEHISWWFASEIDKVVKA